MQSTAPDATSHITHPIPLQSKHPTNTSPLSVFFKPSSFPYKFATALTFDSDSTPFHSPMHQVSNGSDHSVFLPPTAITIGVNRPRYTHLTLHILAHYTRDHPDVLDSNAGKHATEQARHRGQRLLLRQPVEQHTKLDAILHQTTGFRSSHRRCIRSGLRVFILVWLRQICKRGHLISMFEKTRL